MQNEFTYLNEKSKLFEYFPFLKEYFQRKILLKYKGSLEDLNSFSKETFYIYLGKGPSGTFHLGHYLHLKLARKFQEEFNLRVLFMISDDEKKYQTKTIPFKKEALFLKKYFQKEKTKIFFNSEFFSKMYPYLISLFSKITLIKLKKIFYFSDNEPIGKFLYPLVQIAPLLQEEKAKGLIICGQDQVQYFRLSKKKPFILILEFLPGLKTEKMSSSKMEETITLLFEKKDTLKKKIYKIKTGGGHSKEEHVLKGGNSQKNQVFVYLNFFMQKFEKIRDLKEKYSRGEVLDSALKTILFNELDYLYKTENFYAPL